MADKGSHAMEFSRLFRARPEAVFRAFIDPGILGAWWAPRGWITPLVEMDVRVGGSYRFGMREQGKAGMMYVHGKYLDVRPPERLAFTYTWEAGGVGVRWEEFGLAGVETKVTLEFREREDGTEVFIRHEGFPTADGCIQHERGWSSNWDCLEDFVVRGIVKSIF